MPATFPEPLAGLPPAEVSLRNAPLVTVLAQVRFPEQVRIETPEGGADFQDKVKRAYPLFTREVVQHTHIDFSGGSPNVILRPQPLLRFSDAKQDWRVSLAANAITLETRCYTSRNDFLARWETVLEAVQSLFEPQLAQRVGMRYVDRIAGILLEQLSSLVRPEMLGIAEPEFHNYIRHTLSEAALAVAEGDLLLRWGLMPPGGTVDPGVLQPISERSWVLDIDVSSSTQRDFAVDELGAAFRSLAERAYSVFRYMTTDAFLHAYGGDS